MGWQRLRNPDGSYKDASRFDEIHAVHAGSAATLLQQYLRLAANLLGVSRPTLITLLEARAMPYETPGRHRRLRQSDVLTYQYTRRCQQRKALKALASDAQAAVPKALRDTLLRLAETAFSRPLWTDRTLGEVQDAIMIVRPDLDEA